MESRPESRRACEDCRHGSGVTQTCRTRTYRTFIVAPCRWALGTESRQFDSMLLVTASAGGLHEELSGVPTREADE